MVYRALTKEILLNFNRTIVNEQASDVSTLDASAGGMSTRFEDSRERPMETSTIERGIVPLISRLLAFLRVGSPEPREPSYTTSYRHEATATWIKGREEKREEGKS